MYIETCFTKYKMFGEREDFCVQYIYNRIMEKKINK